MGELVGAHPGLPYEGRLRILKSSGIALWDVLESCIRNSSLDSHIEEASVIPNDFDSFFLRHPNIAYVFFNGVKAEQCSEACTTFAQIPTVAISAAAVHEPGKCRNAIRDKTGCMAGRYATTLSALTEVYKNGIR